MNFAKYVKLRKEKFGAVVFDTLNEKVFVTNETGRDILELINEGLDITPIVENLCNMHGHGTMASIQSDVAEFVEQLQVAGLLACAKEDQV